VKLAQYLMMPLYAAQLCTGAKSFADNPLIGSPRLNRWGLHVRRVRLAAAMADWRRLRLAEPVAPEHRAAYGELGYVRIENFLPPEVFEQVCREIETQHFARYDMIQGRTVTRRAVIDEPDLATRPGLRAARNDPRLAALMRYVAGIGGEPLIGLQAVHALPATERGRDPQTVLHSDTFHATAKAWLFLQDVGPEDGPFAYVPGSHRMTPERYAWERALSEDPQRLVSKYARRGSLRIAADSLNELGYGAPLPMTVPANTLIVADTHGFHCRSVSARPTTRIELYGTLRRNPFLPWTGGHTLSLPGIKGRANRAMFEALKLLRRAHLRGNPWRALGPGRIADWPEQLLPRQ